MRFTRLAPIAWVAGLSVWFICVSDLAGPPLGLGFPYPSVLADTVVAYQALLVVFMFTLLALNWDFAVLGFWVYAINPELGFRATSG